VTTATRDRSDKGSGQRSAIARATKTVVVRGAGDLPSFRCGCGPESAPSEISATGLGVLVALALGVGLMALVFISSRCGYDQIAGKDR